jgi:hypothetical protein
LESFVVWGEKIGDILAPPKTYHKNSYAPKPNPLRNKLDTNPDPPIFPHSTNYFQKPIKFKSTFGNVFFGNANEKPSEDKQVEKSSEEKPSEQPHPIKFHRHYCGRDGHKGEFCFKRKCEERMAKEWAYRDRYNPSHGVHKPRMPLPSGKAIMRSVPAWGDASSRSRGGFLERVVRLSWRGGQTGPA